MLLLFGLTLVNRIGYRLLVHENEIIDDLTLASRILGWAFVTVF